MQKLVFFRACGVFLKKNLCTSFFTILRMDADHQAMVQILDPLEGLVSNLPFNSLPAAEAHLKSVAGQPDYEGWTTGLLGTEG